MRGRYDDFGQVDGDASPPVHFANSMRAAPWQGAMPPWHMWGNTERITGVIETVGALRLGVKQQLIKVAYKRPESWHWVFAARLISGPDNTAGFFTRIFVHWQLTLGLGRSATLLFPISGVGTPFAVPSFDSYTFQWGPVGTAFPAGALIFTTESVSPSRSFQADGPAATGTPIQQISAQDIQLDVRAVGLTVEDNVAAAGQPFVVEVSAYFAPITHVRPDWLQLEVPPEAQFAGDEVKGT